MASRPEGFGSTPPEFSLCAGEPPNKGAMMKTPGDFIVNSAQRIKEAESQLAKKHDPLMVKFLRRESSILLRRAWKFWWHIRFK